MFTPSNATARRTALRRGSMISATLVLCGATALSAVAVNPASAGSTPPVTGQQSIGQQSTGQASDWAVPDESVDTAPAELAADVDKNDKARVVAVREENGVPVFDVTPVTGNKQARIAVKREQADDETLAVTVEKKQKFVLGLSNDPYRASQWALTKLQAEKSWTISRGAGQTVAVVDSGVAPVADLSGRLLSGRDFVNNTNGQYDPAGHGTHVAGIIAAEAGNGIGVAGLAPDAKILPVRALDANGSGYSSDIAAGITYATNAGAGVINLSLGGSKSADMEAAVNYAVSKGRVVVAATGNNGNGTVLYPAGFSNVIAVASTRSTDSRSTFSSYGAHVDLSAPGESIISTYQGGYTALSGTSMASPHVAAAVALLRSAAVSKHLGAVNAKRALEITATDLQTKGRDNYTGYGRINPYNALCYIGACGTKSQTGVRVGFVRPVLKLQVVPSASRVVTLQKYSRGKWVAVSTRRTSAGGATRFALQRGVTYRAFVMATNRALPTTTRPIRFY